MVRWQDPPPQWIIPWTVHYTLNRKRFLRWSFNFDVDAGGSKYRLWYLIHFSSVTTLSRMALLVPGKQRNTDHNSTILLIFNKLIWNPVIDLFEKNKLFRLSIVSDECWRFWLIFVGLDSGCFISLIKGLFSNDCRTSRPCLIWTSSVSFP